MWPVVYLAPFFFHAALAETFVLGYLTGSQRKPGDKEYSRPGLTISGAVTYAIDQVNIDLAKNGSPHRLDFKVAETFGDEEVSIEQVAELWKANVSAYIGPQETCVHEARMASSFNLPMISYFCTQQETSDKKFFKTFARTRPPESQISKSVTALLLYYDWTKVAFFYLNEDDGITGKVAITLMDTFRSAGIKILDSQSWPTALQFPYSQDVFRDLVGKTYLHSRIYVILGSHDEHLGLLSAMEERGLLSSGDYFVVGVNLEAYNHEDPTQYMIGLLRKDIDPFAAKGFESYLSIVPSSSISFIEFSLRVNEYLSKPPFSFPSWVGFNKVIPPEAGYLYDAVILYLKGLLKVLIKGGDPRNGTAIIDAIKGAHYLSAMGYMSYIDENGDAQGNYTLLAKRPNPSEPNTFGLYPIGVFTSSDNYTALPELELLEEMIWVNKYVPIAEPVCGFYGENCTIEKNNALQKVLTAGGVILVVFIIGSLVFYRNWRYEQELDSLLWKVDFKDIQISEHDRDSAIGTKMTRATHPLIRTSQVSLSSNPDADFRYSAIFTTIGVYKGRVFAIQKVRKKSIDITRAMKKELKMLRDLRHDNLNPFIGACTEAPNICIVSEYCTRGSLKDILENDNVKLDNMFIASLVSDIVRGMTFLHDSPVRFHGRLKTSNCLVDSRWVLKISDFGLHEFKKGSEDDSNEVTVGRRLEGLLYRAPELLRITGVDEEDIGTQKGDIYSFSIILYELHGRSGPFGETSLTHQEIIDRVSSGLDPPYRPPLEALENSFDFVRECLMECWAENPEARTDFKTIRTRLRPMKKGMKPNIFDNMMSMMEKYTNNLEALVDERTDQLMIEKKKTEALLYEMLPRPVAEQLKRGNKVEAENYDSVTIYFSDIVGFTAMSAESTPLQIVDFLNDLYTVFDSTVENFDVYKVETIGDAYMVVSGLPIRNGDEHAAEIASMSLNLLDSVKKFQIKHRPGEALKLRIGIHSGPVCAGVVGLKMPRYCLFGDTVNTASRMESTGTPGFIHCSGSTKALLDRLGGYHFDERGIVLMKGKGDQFTYWLTGEDPYRKRQRELRRSARKLSPDGQKTKIGPRSSLKNKNSEVTFRRSPLARCSSLESPKKLRFASVDLMEFQKFDLSKDPLLEVISDNSPSKKNLLDVYSNAEHVRRASSSCPCIENFDTSNVPLSPVSQLLSINYHVNTSSSVPALVLPTSGPCNGTCNGNIHIYIDPEDENISTPLLNKI